MKMMLASLDAGPNRENIPDLMFDSKYILCSFWYLNKGIFSKLEELIIQRNKTNDFILDSGAFSMFSQKNADLQQYVEDYIRFINYYSINNFIELDIDPVVGYEEVKTIRKYIEEKTNKQVIPVWHKQRGIQEYQKHIEEYPYVAIGGIVTKEIAKSEYKNFIPMTRQAKKHGTKIHGLGFTNKDCYKYGFYSVDSSSWTQGRRYGTAVKFDGKSIKAIPKPQGVRANYVTIDRNNYIEWCKFQRYVERFRKSCMKITNYKNTISKIKMHVNTIYKKTKERNTMKNAYSKLFTILITVAVANLMISNIIATKQIQFGSFVLPAAMLVFPITYVLSDVISEVYGYKASRFVAWISFALNAFMVLIFALAIKLPYPGYFELQESFSAILGNTPRIFIASAVSYMAGDWMNDLTFKIMKNRYKDTSKGFNARAIISSMVGEAIDASIFIPIAFYGTMPNSAIVQMIALQWVMKIAYEIIILPFTNIVMKKVSSVEMSV